MNYRVNEESLKIINDILFPFKNSYEAYLYQKENDRRHIRTPYRTEKPKTLELTVSNMPTDAYRENIEYSDVPLLLRLVRGVSYIRTDLVDHGNQHGVIYVRGVN